MMRFVSVTGAGPPADFPTVLFRGLAPDGGLYVPERIPERLAGAPGFDSLPGAGTAVLSPFLDAIPETVLREILTRAWTWPVPLTRLDHDVYLIEEFHGPTFAFKDLGARFMAAVMSHLLVRDGRRITILVATSGDTGSAVAHGFHGTENVDVFVLYPRGKVSPLQERQMATLGGNIHAVAVRGTFDDCQALVKRALGDDAVRARRAITTANSINLGRLLPQIAFYAWARSGWDETGHREIPMDVVVPSGNFGNLTAALYAKRMGFGVGTLTAATNANCAVPDYLRTGRFAPAPSRPTYSSAMDVGDPGNWVRIEALYDDLDAVRGDVRGVSVTDEETLSTIRETYETTGVVLDPHTAVGVHAARSRSGKPVAVAATAHPGKFPEVIRKAIGRDPEIPEALGAALERPLLSIDLDADYDAWKRLLLTG
jgi:threonine synthase